MRTRYHSIDSRSVSIWRRRIDRALNKLRKGTCIVHVVKRKRLGEHLITILRYDLSTAHQEMYTLPDGKQCVIADLPGGPAIHLSYGLSDKSIGSFGAMWVMQIHVSSSGTITTRYSNHRSPTCGDDIIIGEVNSDEGYHHDIIPRIIFRQFSQLDLTPKHWETDKQWSVTWAIESVDNIDSLPIMFLNAAEDTEKVLDLLQSYFNVKIKKSNNVITVTPIAELPNN